MKMQKLRIIGLSLGLMLGFTVAAYADANCYCKVSCSTLTGTTGGGDIVKDYSTGLSWPTQVDVNHKKRDSCSKVCADKAAADFKNPALATACCALGFPTGTIVRAYSTIGTIHNYNADAPIGTLTNTPGVTTCTCPRDWLSPTNMLGGVTSDGKCKKLSCLSNSISPFPADGTQIGTWGFTWGGGFWAWGSPANGGAAKCITTPGTCSFG